MFEAAATALIVSAACFWLGLMLYRKLRRRRQGACGGCAGCATRPPLTSPPKSPPT